MLLFIAVLTKGFAAVGKLLAQHQDGPAHQKFLIWTIGCTLFGHAASMMSISYFDQTIIFLYLVLAAIGSVHGTKLAEGSVVEKIAQSDVGIREESLCHNC